LHWPSLFRARVFAELPENHTTQATYLTISA
jgi:hypothetical protein